MVVRVGFPYVNTDFGIALLVDSPSRFHEEEESMYHTREHGGDLSKDPGSDRTHRGGYTCRF